MKRVRTPPRACAPHNVCVGVAPHLAHDQIEGERRQLLHARDCNLALLFPLLPLRRQLIVHLADRPGQSGRQYERQAIAEALAPPALATPSGLRGNGTATREASRHAEAPGRANAIIKCTGNILM